MKNLWSDDDAQQAIASHAAKGIGEDLALRVYTTRLLGGEPKLVLHGGGNTSVKTRMADVTGRTLDVLQALQLVFHQLCAVNGDRDCAHDGLMGKNKRTEAAVLRSLCTWEVQQTECKPNYCSRACRLCKSYTCSSLR